MPYRTKTYIAADWDNDKAAVDQLYSWKNNGRLNLDFHDAHELTQARDTSLPCSIKSSLKTRMDVSKTFVMIVGPGTDSVTKGGCRYCGSYNNWTRACARGHSIDTRSFIKYECDEAVAAGINIIVLYNSTVVDKKRCPEAVRNIGQHVPMQKWMNGTRNWDYDSVKKAFDKIQ